MAIADEVVDKMATVEVEIVARADAKISRREARESPLSPGSRFLGAANDWVAVPIVVAIVPLSPASGATKDDAGVEAARSTRKTDFMLGTVVGCRM